MVLLARREHARSRWENRGAEGVEIEDLDHEEIRRTVRLGIEAGRLPEATLDLEPAAVLQKLHLLRDGQVLNAAVVLFGQPTPADFPQCRLHMAHFRGTTKTGEMIDQREPIYGHAFRLAEEAELFLVRNLPQAGRVVPGIFERIDEPLFPIKALREALYNALAHRDYSLASGSIHLAVYADRVEITNSGALPIGLRLEDLKTLHESKPRNPLIADVFYKRRLIEQWGRGTEMIVDLCVAAGHPEPEYFTLPGSFGVRLFAGRPITSVLAAPAITQRQLEILRALARSVLPLREIPAHVTNPPALTTLRDDLARLKELGLIGSRGRGRGAVWYLLPEGVERLRIERAPSPELEGESEGQ